MGGCHGSTGPGSINEQTKEEFGAGEWEHALWPSSCRGFCTECMTHGNWTCVQCKNKKPNFRNYDFAYRSKYDSTGCIPCLNPPKCNNHNYKCINELIIKSNNYSKDFNLGIDDIPTIEFSVEENIDTPITTFTANENVTWFFNTGPDIDPFELDKSTGVLTFKDTPDFETPTDVDSKNDYEFTIIAKDSVLNESQALTVKVTVTDVDEIAPLITGPSGIEAEKTDAINVKENTTTIHTFSASETVTWDIDGGTDSDKFIINSSTGLFEYDFSSIL